jgi:hypothetical protein
MLDGIPVNIVHMPLKIVIISDQMIPESPLPNTAFIPLAPVWGQLFAIFYPTREAAFDQPPTD